MVTGRGQRAGDREDVSTLLIPCVKQTMDGLTLHGAGDSALCPVMTGAGRESEKEETCVHVGLIHFAMQSFRVSGN